MQLNVVRLLADLNVAVNKSEVVDMILPLFIESLEEGDASTPSLLRLRVSYICVQRACISKVGFCFYCLIFIK